jgi:hypothetical protein
MTALADAAVDFEVTEVFYEDGTLKAVGQFTNTGDKSIEKVNKVDVKIFLYNDAGDSEQVANHYFTDLTLHLEPGEVMEYTLEFPDVAEYTDATKWSAEEGEWEFTYFDEAEAAESEEEAVETEEEAVETEGEAALDFEVISVGYENGILTANGKFINIGDKKIEKVNKVDVKIFLYNDEGDSEQVADHVFTDLEVNLKAGEEVEYTLEFPDVAEYTDATKWSAEEGEWEFTYLE